MNITTLKIQSSWYVLTDIPSFSDIEKYVDKIGSLVAMLESSSDYNYNCAGILICEDSLNSLDEYTFKQFALLIRKHIPFKRLYLQLSQNTAHQFTNIQILQYFDSIIERDDIIWKQRVFKSNIDKLNTTIGFINTINKTDYIPIAFI